MVVTKKELENYKQAGKITTQVIAYAKKITKQGTPLSKIAEDIEKKIIDLGGQVAFPVNLSIDDIAAHFTPALKDEAIAKGLLKIDLGVHIKGSIIDTAFTIDLSKSKEHEKMVKAVKHALENAIDLVKKYKSKTKFNEIGKIIHKTITDSGFSPIKNLSGHSLDLYEIHAGMTIPNYDNGNENGIGEGAFAIEPFATTGSGVVYEGSDSKIFHLIKDGQVRDRFAREILKYIQENKKTLPFSERELERKFGARVRLALKRLEEAGIIKNFPQLIEKNHMPVAQFENTILITKDKVEVLT